MDRELFNRKLLEISSISRTAPLDVIYRYLLDLETMVTQEMGEKESEPERFPDPIKTPDPNLDSFMNMFFPEDMDNGKMMEWINGFYKR